MTRDVSVKIIGLQFGADGETVSMTTPGTYHLTNEKHYIRYEEKQEDQEEGTKCTLKISPSEIVLTRKGIQQLQMSFALCETTKALYHTPYGSLSLDITTKSIVLKEALNKIEVVLKYSLSSQGEPLSDNELTIIVEEG